MKSPYPACSDPPALIVPHVYLGSLDSLTAKGCFSRLLSLVPINGLGYSAQLHLQVDQVQDSLDQDLLQHIDPCISFIRRAVEQQQTVLVHCAAGVSRSAAMVAAYLMAYEDNTLQEALERMREQRPAVGPNSGFLFQLRVFEAILQRNRSPPFIQDRNPLVQFVRSLLVAQSFHPGSNLWPSAFQVDLLADTPQEPMSACCTTCRRPVLTSQHTLAASQLHALTGHSATCPLLSHTGPTMAVVPPTWMRESAHPAAASAPALASLLFTKISCPWTVNGPMYTRAAAAGSGVGACRSRAGQLGSVWWTWKACPGCGAQVRPPLALVRRAAVYWQHE